MNLKNWLGAENLQPTLSRRIEPPKTRQGVKDDIELPSIIIRCSYFDNRRLHLILHGKIVSMFLREYNRYEIFLAI